MKALAVKVKAAAAKCRDSFITTRMTRAANYIWAIIKIVFGLISGALFFSVSGLYTLAVGLSKNEFLKSRRESAPDAEKERIYYLRICLILTVASVAYIVYMVRLFFYPAALNYGIYFAIGWAALSFTELAMAVTGLAKSNRKKDLLLSGLRCINLASAFTALAFTQTAILSFTQPDADTSFFSAVGGVVFGSLCLLICVYMLVKFFISGKAAARKSARRTAGNPDAAATELR